MGTKLGLHSAGFLRTLMRRQLLLSAACGVALIAGAALFIFADTADVRPTGALAWWVTIAGAVVMPLLLGAWYARRSSDIEDEMLGLVDISTLPPSVTARVLDDALRGD